MEFSGFKFINKQTSKNKYQIIINMQFAKRQ